jgi:hypothetical protein
MYFLTGHDMATNAEFVEEGDLAILTGMTLPNRTLRAIMATAKSHNTSTVWAITGRELDTYYLEHDVDSVIVDPSPFSPCRVRPRSGSGAENADRRLRKLSGHCSGTCRKRAKMGAHRFRREDWEMTVFAERWQ